MPRSFPLSTAALLLTIMVVSSCYGPLDWLDGPRPIGQPMPPPMNYRDFVTPPPMAKLGIHLPETREQNDCVMPGELEGPRLPETDCVVWGYLHSLVVAVNEMEGRETPLFPEELQTLEEEIYPLFVQAKRNCEVPSNPENDYESPTDLESLTDLLHLISWLAFTGYNYHEPILLEHLIEGAATEEFAQSAREIGCVKSFLLLFVDYKM